ncbi:hypothetical protein LINGRAHAP2_LOCUS28733 [Linum grandiflorum]
MRKIQISNLPNLKALTIYDCNQLEEIQMAAASELRTLHLRASSFGVSTKLTKVDLNAPQLSVLEMINTGLKIVDIQDVVSKLPCLKSLTLAGFFRSEKKLQLSSYELDELIISTKGLEEMELDANPHLQKLLLRYDDHTFLPDEMTKCRMTNFPVTCQRQVDFEMRLLRPWYVRFRSLTLRFSEFEAIKVCCKLSSCEVHNLDWPKKNLDYTKHPTSIPHLKIEPHPSFLHPLGLKVLYDVLFWACHPKILTICDKYSYRGKMLVDYVLSQYRRKLAVKDDEEGFNGRRSWQHQLKDVNIIAQDVRENNGLMGVSENVLASLKLENQVCLMLSWD